MIEIGPEDGSARVAYLCSDKKYGQWLLVGGKRGAVEIRVTPGGNVRVGEKWDAAKLVQCGFWEAAS